MDKLKSIGTVIGRNGSYSITEIRIVALRPYSSEVDIDAIGLRGKRVRGGFVGVNAKELEVVCAEFLRLRGYYVTTPEAMDRAAKIIK